MASKVRWIRGAWWVVTHAHGKRTKRRIGPRTADKRQAEEIARKINAAFALGTLPLANEQERDRPCGKALDQWHKTYRATFKRSFEAESRRIIDGHLAPFFGQKDLREIREQDLLGYIQAKLDVGLAPATILTHLSVLRRVLNLALREGIITVNAAARLGELMRRVDRRIATEAKKVDSWTREEVERLLHVAREQERESYPALLTLLSTGIRRGELCGLKSRTSTSSAAASTSGAPWFRES